MSGANYPNIVNYSSTDPNLSSGLRESMIRLNRTEEEGLKRSAEKELAKGEITEQQAIDRLNMFMSMWGGPNGTRVFPVIPGYIEELKGRQALKAVQKIGPIGTLRPKKEDTEKTR